MQNDLYIYPVQLRAVQGSIQERGDKNMSISLKKGQRISLAKDDKVLNELMIGLGWDAAEGAFNKLFSLRQSKIDCDAFAILLRRDDKLFSNSDVVAYYNLKHNSGAVIHHGDNLTGEGDGDDEIITVSLNQLPSDVQKIVLGVNIYQANSRHQDFGKINNAFIRLVNSQTHEEICKYNLTNQFKGATAVIFGEVYKHNDEWKFAAVGQPVKAGSNSIPEIAKTYA